MINIIPATLQVRGVMLIVTQYSVQCVLHFD